MDGRAPDLMFLCAPGRIRTCDTRFRRAVLYPLSYEGGDLSETAPRPDTNGGGLQACCRQGHGGQTGQAWTTADSVAGRVRSASVFDHWCLGRGCCMSRRQSRLTCWPVRPRPTPSTRQGSPAGPTRATGAPAERSAFPSGAVGTLFQPANRPWNRSQAKIRAFVERAMANLKNWRLLRKLRCSTTRITALIRAVVTLHQARSAAG